MTTANHYRPWTVADEDVLRTLYLDLSDAEIGARLGRSERAIAHRRRCLGLYGPTKRPWTVRDRQTLISMYGAYTAREIGRHLGRTTPAVQQQCHYLGLAHWTAGEGEA